MENRESTGTARPQGMCNKLFNALHLSPTFRQLRRIAYHSQEPVAVAAAKPASLPPATSSVGVDGPAPPVSKSSSGLEYSGGAAAAARQASEKKAPEPKLSKVQSESVTVPLKVPSKVERPPPAAGATAIPPQKPSYVEPQPPPPSRLPTERVPSSSGKSPAPARPPEKVVSKTDSTKASVAADRAKPAPAAEPPPPARLPTERAPGFSDTSPSPAPRPEKVVSKTDGTTESGDGAKPAPAAEVGRTRTRRNLNDRVDEYINRTMNRLRTPSNAGGSSSSSNPK